MLPRPHRLTGKRAFTNLYQRGRTAKGRHLLLRMLPSRLPIARAAVVMSTKAARQAVIRNHHKRKIRAILSQLLVKQKVGSDILVTVHTAVRERKEFDQLEEELRTLLSSLS